MKKKNKYTEKSRFSHTCALLANFYTLTHNVASLILVTESCTCCLYEYLCFMMWKRKKSKLFSIQEFRSANGAKKCENGRRFDLFTAMILFAIKNHRSEIISFISGECRQILLSNCVFYPQFMCLQECSSETNDIRSVKRSCTHKTFFFALHVCGKANKFYLFRYLVQYIVVQLAQMEFSLRSFKCAA